MKKKIAVLLFLAFLGIQTSAQAFQIPFLSSLFNKSNETAKKVQTTSTKNTQAAISDINKKLATVDTSTINSLVYLVTACSTNEDSAKIAQAINQINSNTNLTEAEKSAQIAQVMANYSQVLKNTKTAVINKLTNLSNAEKTKVANSIKSLAQAGSKYSDVAKDCLTVAKLVADNSANATEAAQNIIQLKNTATAMKNNATTAAKVANQALNIARAAGYNI